MSNPDEAVVAELRPAPADVEKGKDYYWCACGRSKNQPFCDGSHQGTSFTPQQFTAEETRTVYLCQCKQAQKAPFCDGTHSKLDAESKGKSLPVTK